MGSQEIISGNLQVLKNSLINRSWQSRWCVLYDGSGARLEYFDNQEGMNRQSAHKKVVLLEKISRIEKMQPKQSSFPFDVTVKSGKLSFVARSASECESWIQAFTHIMNQEMGLTSPPVALPSADPSSSGLVDNVLYESTELVTKFPVTLVESESKAAKNKDLVGKLYLLAVGRLGYDLFEATGQTSLHHWPFRYVRKFGATEDHFILLGGSRCEEWAGEYKFLTSEGQAIKSAVDRMTRLLAPSANIAIAFPNEGPPPVKEKPVPPQPGRGSTSEVGGAASKHEILPSSGVRDTTRAPPSAGGIFQGPSAECMAELDDKLYEFTKVRPDLEFRHPKHQDKLQGKVSAQLVAPTPGSVASAAPSNQNKAPLQSTNSQPSVEINEQKSQPLTRAHSADYDKAQKKKAKEDKKREEKERKEQEKREKEQQERERKEQEKREKEEKKKKSREKSKTKSSTMSKATAMLAHKNVNTYEEVDVPSPPAQDKDAQENAYTEADFRPQPPANYPTSRGHIYSEPDLASTTASVVSANPPQAVYSQVMKHRSEAWKEFGRTEDNLHEEDYDRIKLAAKEAEQTMLPNVIPVADEDETYDSLALPSVYRDRPSTKTNSDMDNVYGLASAVPAMSSQLSSAADSESGYEDAELVNAAATAFQRNANYNPSHNYEEPDFRSMASPEEEEEEEEEDPYTNA